MIPHVVSSMGIAAEGGDKAEKLDLKTPRIEVRSGVKRKFAYEEGDQIIYLGPTSWDELFECLIEFKNQQGHCEVDPDCQELYGWVEAQRKARKKRRKSPLQVEHEAKLDSIGFSWESNQMAVHSCPRKMRHKGPPQAEHEAQRRSIEGIDKDRKWKVQFRDLCKYKAEHGNADGGVSNAPLARFAKRQRYEYRLWIAGEKTDFTAEKKKQLDAIGFDWRGYDTPFTVKVSVAPCGEHVVTAKVAEPVTIKARRHMSAALVGERRQHPVDGAWESSLRQISHFQKKNGRIPTEGTKLYKWFVKQTAQYASKKQNLASSLSDSQVAMLEEDVGFTYEPAKTKSINCRKE